MFLNSSVVRRGRTLLPALLVASISLAAARAQEPSPARPIQEPSPTQTPTPTPTPTPSPSPTPEEAEEVYRIDTDLTNVLLLAVDKKRRFLTTLRPEDLRLTEDGVEQKIETFEQETDAPLSLALLVDTTASQDLV
jgi:heme-binding NEAT domain protein